MLRRQAFRVRLVIAIISLATASLSIQLASAENWPQWRGPDNNGVSTATKLPVKWDEKSKNVRWRLPLPGKAGSTPVVWGERVFMTSTANDKDLVLICVNTSGQIAWQRTVASGNRKRSEGNDSSPSPSTDGKHVWCFFGTGDLACYTVDGAKVWQTNIQERYGKFRLGFGMHMTPVLHGDSLYLQLIHSNAAWVLALDKATGEEQWKIKRESDGVAECEHSYASPIVWQKGDDALLITHGNDYAIGHQLKDGKEVWRLGDLNPKAGYNRTLRFVASPVATADLIVVPTAKNRSVVGLKPTARGAVNTERRDHVQWWMPRNTPDVPSPLVHDGIVYLCRENGVLIALDAKTGEMLYSEPTNRTRHRASPVYADGKVYLTGTNGIVTVVKAGRSFQQLAQNKLDDQFQASPALAGRRIYLRGFEKLYAIEERFE